MEKDEIQSMAFMIIAHAGSSFDHFYKAIEAARLQDYDKSEEEMKLGVQDMHEAHKSQTKLLTAEVKNEDIPFSILMTHAQDHLTMGILTERMAREFIMLYKEKEALKSERT